MYQKQLIRLSAIIFVLSIVPAIAVCSALAFEANIGSWIVPPYTTTGGLPSNYIYFVKTDSAQRIWCCSAEGTDQAQKGGISKYIGDPQRTPPEWATYDTSSGLPDKRVFCFDFDRAGDIWVATQKGVCKMNAAGSVLYRPSELADQPTRFVAVNPANGDVWVAKANAPGNSAALYRFDGQTWNRYDSTNTPNGPSDWSINTIAIDSQRNNVWIGTSYGGATRFAVDEGVWTNYTVSNSSLPNATVNVIAMDGPWTVWFGTATTYGDRKGAAKLDLATGRWSLYSVGDADAVSITKSADGIWFGTRTTGVYLLDESKPANQQWQASFSHSSTLGGLPNDDVRGVAYDSSGNIWFATLSGGLGRFLPKGGTPSKSQSPTQATTTGGTGTASANQSTAAQTTGSKASGTEQTASDVLARTGLDLLPYLAPGLLLILTGIALRYWMT